ncbi:MAG: metallophosphoesterase [Chitinophagaceae bacterium]
MRRILFFLITCLILSCKNFVYHPDEIRPNAKQLNPKNIQKIQSLAAKTSFKFILIGDTQRFYDELEAFVAHVNSKNDISFVLFDGDLVDFGWNREYNWVYERLAKLKLPYISTIGNHDMLANGRLIYKEMFGPENFTFNYSGSKFICLNTNSREAGYDGTIPDVNWLTNELKDTTPQNIFILAHVPPFSDDFNRGIEFDYRVLLRSNPKTRLSLNGHEHQYRLVQPYFDGLEYLVAGAGNQRNYALITVNGTEYSIEEKFY